MEISQRVELAESRLGDLIRNVRDVVTRRWLTLLLVTGVIVAAGIGLMFVMTPQYQSTAKVRIDPSQRPAESKNDGNKDLLGPEAIETEVSSLYSLDLAQSVVRSLNLTQDPAFVGTGEKREGMAQMSQSERELAVAGAVLRNLSVARDRLTYIITVSYRSPSAVDSARIANAFAENYIKLKTGSNAGTAERQSAWYQQRLQQLSTEMRQAETQLADYRGRSGLADGGSEKGTGTMVDQQVAPVATALAEADSQAAASRSKAEAARAQVAAGHLDSVNEVRISPVIASLRAQRAEILRNMGEVQARYSDKHPESIRVRDQLSSIDKQIREEAVRVIGSLSADVQADETRAASLRNSMAQLEAKRIANTRAAAMAQSMERDAAAKRASYEKMSELALTTSQQAQNSFAEALIVERAQVPKNPSWPNKPLLVALSLIVGLFAGSATIAVQEMLVTGMRTTEEVEAQLGLTVLAAVPVAPKSVNPANLLLERPNSLFAESLRIARASILGVKNARKPQIIAFTSALPSEGKTTTSLSFARTVALNGTKTLLLECDVRRAQMRHLVSTPQPTFGIVEVLHGDATLEQAIHPGDVPDLDHLLVRAPYFSSEDLFGDGTFERLLAELRTRYETIVLDNPPLLGLADGRFLSVLADAVVFIIRWDGTPGNAAASAVNLLRSDGANPVGAVFTMVDSSAEVIGGVYYSKYYSKKYSNYYRENEE